MSGIVEHLLDGRQGRATVLVLSGAEVSALLDLDELVEALQAAMIDLSAGRASVPPRVAAQVPEHDAMLAAMPAYLPSAGALASKLVSLFPGNREQPTHQALICCFDPATGTPAALMDGTYVTAVRTAGGSALATRLLARPDAQHVTVIGTGVQAAAHARALARRPGVRTVWIAGRDPGRAERLARELAGDGVPARAAGSIEAAVRAAQIVCTTTHAAQPVLRREWLRPGTHINSVGYNTSGDGELDTATIQQALVVVESRAAALAPPPAGAVELRRAIELQAIDAGHIAAEIGQVAAGTVPGRTSDTQLTVYKSVGVAAQDAAAAALILAAAQQRGVGTSVSL
jgi:ornithine cyclodeaminase/alanine dehydrogenase-like protein (mu-crystallin family)